MVGRSFPNPLSWLANLRGPRLALGSRGPFGMRQAKLPLEDLDTHLYVVGQTGKGKSQFLNHLAFQLVTQDQGVGVIDPHGDLVNDLLRYLASHPRSRPWLSVPENRERVILFDPNRDDYAVPFNVLSTNQRPYITAQNIIEAMRRTWPKELEAAPRFTNIALHSLLVLIKNNRSLVELPRLLTEQAFRDELLAKTDEPDLIHFFHQRFDRWGSEAPLMIESLLNKITAFTLNPYLKPLLGASNNRLPVRHLMDESKIVLVNLRTPEEETRNLLGSLLMTQFEQAALSRAELPKDKRAPFFLVVDEFQKFAATAGSAATIAEILSECRKYGLHMCFAHQSWAQMKAQQRLVGALEQAQIKVVFGTGRQTAQALVGELYEPDPETVKHEVEDPDQQERTHPMYTPLHEQFEAFTQNIQRLNRRDIVVQLPGQSEAVQLKTLTVPESRIDRHDLERIKHILVKQIGRPRGELIKEISRRSSPPEETYQVTDREPLAA